MPEASLPAICTLPAAWAVEVRPATTAARAALVDPRVLQHAVWFTGPPLELALALLPLAGGRARLALLLRGGGAAGPQEEGVVDERSPPLATGKLRIQALLGGGDLLPIHRLILQVGGHEQALQAKAALPVAAPALEHPSGRIRRGDV